MPEPHKIFDPVAILRERFIRAIAAAAPDAPGPIDPLISPSKMPRLGDFQSNAAMGLGKRLGIAPRQMAARIVENLDIDDIAEPLGAESIAGPGFINVRLRTQTLGELLDRLARSDLGIEPPSEPQTIVVDLCGVNLAKQMHVGHLRATVIGDALARTFERLGHSVVRQNHLGDWGLPIAMVTGRLARESRAGQIDLDDLSLEDLERLYRDEQLACRADHAGLAAVERFGLGPKAEAELEEQVAGAEEALARAKATLVRLQSHDPETVAIWQRIVDVTMDGCMAICRRLHAKVGREDTAGESSYARELPGVVADLLAPEHRIAEESDGAVVVRVEGIAEPCIVRKSDGGFLYATTDLAGIRRRVQELGADRVIYAVDARQSLHFRLVFAVAKKAGYVRKADSQADSILEHAAFGTILGEDNRPFRTRTGENVKLSDLLDEAASRAESAVAEKNPDLDASERREIAEAVGVAAIKYTDLSNDRVKDYVFSFDRMLAFEGNTGPYLLYALVRIRSIFRKAGERGIRLDERVPFALNEPEERSLALTLLRYPSTLAMVGQTLEPHRLCGFVYELATAFSGFFDRCPVLRADNEQTRASRLRLCDLTARVLQDALDVLGIPTLERM